MTWGELLTPAADATPRPTACGVGRLPNFQARTLGRTVGNPTILAISGTWIVVIVLLVVGCVAGVVLALALARAAAMRPLDYDKYDFEDGDDE